MSFRKRFSSEDKNGDNPIVAHQWLRCLLEACCDRGRAFETKLFVTTDGCVSSTDELHTIAGVRSTCVFSRCFL